MFGLFLGSTARFIGRTDRRQSERKPARLPGFVVVAGDTIPCTTANLSDGGALLIFARYLRLPDLLVLHLPSQGLRARARVVWQEDVKVGVEFVR